MHEVFVATAGGVLVYDISRSRWEDPAVMGYGAFESVPIDDALLVLYDERTSYLWVTTRDRLLRWNRGLDRWEIVREHVWPVGERPVNIGVSEQSLHVETIPEQVFGELHVPGTPIPDPVWLRYVRRYSGDRSSGNLFSDFGASFGDTLRIRWRGLRSKVPIKDSELVSGVLGQLPAGLPMILPPRPYIWYPDGTLADEKNRTYPITDWLIDSWDVFWSTHWGAGIMRTELRGLRSELTLGGPAGNDIRALLPLDRELWLGGYNDGDFMGISVVENFGEQWRTIEKRHHSQIRSTMVEDMVFLNDRVWIATHDGLLSYAVKKRNWKRYDVQDNLQSQHVTALAVAGDNLWIGSDDGLAVMNTKSNTIVRIPNSAFELSKVNEMLITDGIVWVGTDIGLYKVDEQSHESAAVMLEGGVVTGPITELSSFGSDLWIAATNCVARLSADGETKTWQAATWLKMTTPLCIMASDPYVWVGTDGGLFRFEPEREAWEHYTRRDGLVDDRVQVLRVDRGDLWIGTAGGLSRYYYSRPGKPR